MYFSVHYYIDVPVQYYECNIAFNYMYYENVHIRVRLDSLQKITFTVIYYLKYIILT